MSLAANSKKLNELKDQEMDQKSPSRQVSKPLAGTCQHHWQEQESPFALAQLCTACRLFRYKASATADWEYRAPIPIGKLEAGQSGS